MAIALDIGELISFRISAFERSSRYPRGWCGSSMRRIPIWRVRRSWGPLPGRSRGGSDEWTNLGAMEPHMGSSLGWCGFPGIGISKPFFPNAAQRSGVARPTPAEARSFAPLIPPDPECRMLNKLSAWWACGSCLYCRQGEPVQTSELLAAIDEEIARLERARALLAGSETGLARRWRPAGAFSGLGASGTVPKKRRTISAAGRARIAAAQKARWAKVKRAAKRAAAATSAKAAATPKTRKAVKNAPAGKAKSKKKAASRRSPAKAVAPANPTPAAEASAS